MGRLKRNGEAGVSAIEYSLLAALIAMAIVIAGLTLKAAVGGLYGNVGAQVEKATGGP